MPKTGGTSRSHGSGLGAPSGPPGAGDITLLLRRMERGDSSAAAEVFTTLYDALRAQARATVRTQSRSRSRSHTLQPTELVNEVFLKLVRPGIAPEDRTHFLAVAASAMRCVLVDRVRTRLRQKRSPAGRRVELDDLVFSFEERSVHLIDLDEALQRFAEENPRAARIVEMRFFGGLDLPDIARILRVNVRTAERDWRYARAWLHAELA
jgi:RNA polymerase sigma factor (TIGR02999 family)